VRRATTSPFQAPLARERVDRASKHLGELAKALPGLLHASEEVPAAEPTWPPPRRASEAPAQETAPAPKQETPQPKKEAPTRRLQPPPKFTDHDSRREFRERAIPSTSLGRAFGFGTLGAKMAASIASDWASSALGMGKPLESMLLSKATAETLVDGLCRMRGAALKVGQMLSLQDEEVIGKDVAAIMEKVRTQANVMPRWQLEETLTKELGDDWLSRLGGTWRPVGTNPEEARATALRTRAEGGVQSLEEDAANAPPADDSMVGFDEHPVAAASIGQVHRAVLSDGRRVAIKVQYPGVADSIDSDINNATRLLKLGLGSALPPGLYLDSAMRVARKELTLECDYEHEARAQERFRRELVETAEREEAATGRRSLLSGIRVPGVVAECSSKRVLTTEWLDGVPIDKVFEVAPQSQRDFLARQMLRLTLWELFDARLMQTDPNWGNFFVSPAPDGFEDSEVVLGLLDFGAAKEFPAPFVDDYLRLVWASAQRDEDAIVEASCRMGFFTGHETPSMVRAHINAGNVIGEPFATTSPYDFRASRVAARVSKYSSIFAKDRLTPPPDEVYALHRKLAGAYLLCIRMGAVFRCRDILERTVEEHRFTTPPLEGLPALESLKRKATGSLGYDTREAARQEVILADDHAKSLGLPEGTVLPQQLASTTAPVGEGTGFVSARPLRTRTFDA
jgi:aarF domain-containing kinase